MGHEYFHNWSGNRVTLRDWFQLSLKEGLTNFRQQGFEEDMTSAAVRRIEEVRVIRAAQFPQDAGPMAHSVRPESYSAIDNFYTVRDPPPPQLGPSTPRYPPFTPDLTRSPPLLPGDGLQQGRRGHPHDAHADRLRRLQEGHGAVL